MEVYVNPRVNDQVYLKNPMEFDLGKKIISNTVHMMHDIGFEQFTFKKLGKEIGSTEASIYRYFPNKQRLLVYLSAWYWEFLHYLIKLKTKEIEDPKKKLKVAIKTLVYAPSESNNNCFLEMQKLQDIVIEQFYKIIRTKRVTIQNESGYFESFKRLCSTLAGIFKEIDPNFNYPMTMATAVIEMSINNHFCSSNLPTLTEIKCGKDQKQQIEQMMTYFCERLFKKCDC